MEMIFEVLLGMSYEPAGKSRTVRGETRTTDDRKTAELNKWKHI